MLRKTLLDPTFALLMVWSTLMSGFVPEEARAQEPPLSVEASTPGKPPAPLIEVEILASEMLSLFYLAEAVGGVTSRSPYLIERYEAHRGEVDVARDLRQVFDAIPGGMRFYEGAREVPQERYNGQNAIDVLEIMALQSENLEDFKQRSRPMMPVAEHAKLMRALRTLEPIHRLHIWEPSKLFLARAKLDLEKARHAYKMEALLQRIATFYGSAWPNGEAITIGLVPVPGKRERSISYAHSAGAFEIVEIMEEDDIDSRFGVLIHELCHSLYQAQPPERQTGEVAKFKSSRTLSAHLAQLEINEAVATAIGNGWVEADIQANDVADTLWYNDPVIDAYSKAIYPDIKRYLEEGKTWDDALTERMIERFRETFPDAHRSPLFIFQEISLVVDADNGFKDERAPLRSIFRRAGNTHYSRPAGHPLSLQAYESTQGYTALFLLGRKNTRELSKYPFYAKHHRKLDRALKSKKPFFYATRDVPDQRLHLFIGPGSQVSMLSFYKKLAALEALPLDEVVEFE
jgi:hypothetical protein